jgi:hypothetical protein
MVDDIEDPRRREPYGEEPERERLEKWLEFHRTTALLKCEGVDEVDLKQRPVATSNLVASRSGTPHGRGRAHLVPARAGGQSCAFHLGRSSR